jgi:hypothetical protein
MVEEDADRRAQESANYIRGQQDPGDGPAYTTSRF